MLSELRYRAQAGTSAIDGRPGCTGFQVSAEWVSTDRNSIERVSTEPSFERPGFARHFPRSSTESKVYAIHNFRFSDRSDRATAARKPRPSVPICAMKNSQEVSTMQFTKASARFVVLAMSVLLLVPGMLFAQSATKGAVSGTVTDASNAVVSGTTVTLRSLDKG